MSDASESPTRLLVGQTLARRYRIVRELGAGGMGAVLEAENVALGRRVAIKVLHPELLDRRNAIERFHREARAAAACARAGVVDVLDLDEDPRSGPFLVMEYLEGQTLASLLARERRLDLGRAVEIVAPLLEALAAVHARGIVHRDLKPANVFLARDAEGRSEIVKVLDFGLARSVTPAGESPLTLPGSVLGTPRFMAPEQASGDTAIDHRADLYAIGAILYRCLAGVPPYAGVEGAAVVRAAIVGPPTPLQAMRPDLAPSVLAVVARSMARRADDRFRDAREMLAALRACVDPPSSAHSEAALSAHSEAALSAQSEAALSAHSEVATAAPAPAMRSARSEAVPPNLAQEPVWSGPPTRPPPARDPGRLDVRSSARSRAPLWALAASVLVLGVGVAVLGVAGILASRRAPAASPSQPARPGVAPLPTDDDVPAQLRARLEAGRAFARAGRTAEARAAFEAVVRDTASERFRSPGARASALASLELGNLDVADHRPVPPLRADTRWEDVSAVAQIGGRGVMRFGRVANRGFPDLDVCALTGMGRAQERTGDVYAAVVAADPTVEPQAEMYRQLGLHYYREARDSYAGSMRQTGDSPACAREAATGYARMLARVGQTVDPPDR